MNVFCWLGWKQPRITARAASAPRAGARTAAAASGSSTPAVAQRGPQRFVAERAERHDHLRPGRAARARGRGTAGTGRAPRASACSRAARTAPRRAMYASCSSSPSSIDTDVGWFANPARCSDAKSKSPDRSPVNIRPVRFAPCAAGARPDDQQPGARVAEARAPAGPSSPRRGTTARFVAATSSRHATEARAGAARDDLRVSSRAAVRWNREASPLACPVVRVLLIVNATASSVTARKRVDDPEGARRASTTWR